MSRERLLDIAVATLVLCALVTTTLVVRREFFVGMASAAVPSRIKEWRDYSRDGHRMGPADAPVSVIVFSDFQCPYCAALMEGLRTLRSEHPREVAVIYRHFPLASHKAAVAAVRASECAAAQGRFEAYHDALFAGRDSIGHLPWESFAREAGITDLPRFRECAAETGPLPALARDTVAGKRLEVTGTPTLLINETRLQGLPPMDTLRSYVQRALETAQQSLVDASR